MLHKIKLTQTVSLMKQSSKLDRNPLLSQKNYCLKGQTLYLVSLNSFTAMTTQHKSQSRDVMKATIYLLFHLFILLFKLTTANISDTILPLEIKQQFI